MNRAHVVEAVTGAILIGGALAGCSPAENAENNPDAPQPGESHSAPLSPNTALQQQYDAHPTSPLPGENVAVYVQIDQDPAIFNRAAKEIADGSLSEIDLAFAYPNMDGILQKPVIGPELSDMIDKIGTKADVALAIGGFSLEGSQEKMLQRMDAAADNPDAFGQSVKSVVDELGQDGIKIDRIKIDYEYPSADKRAKVQAMLRSVKAVNPDLMLTYAIAAQGAEVPADAIAPYVDSIDGMTVDLNGPGWSDTADHASPGTWQQESYKEIAKAGKPVSLELPTYCRVYPNADGKGSDYKVPTEESVVDYRDVPVEKIVDDEKALTSSAQLGPDWATCESPNIMKRTVQQLRSETGAVSTVFWDLKGLTGAHLAAVETK
jgi:hypothetical protein